MIGPARRNAPPPSRLSKRRNGSGLRRADVKPFVPLSDSALSRQLHRLRALGLIKRVSRSYRYYLTRRGRAAIAAACSLTQFQIVPAMAIAR